MGRIGDDGVFPQPGGDNAYSPNGKWYVGSHRIDLKQFYTFYRFEDNAHFVSEGIPTFRGKTEGNGAFDVAARHRTGHRSSEDRTCGKAPRAS